jgi:hypothetical protein
MFSPVSSRCVRSFTADFSDSMMICSARAIGSLPVTSDCRWTSVLRIGSLPPLALAPAEPPSPMPPPPPPPVSPPNSYVSAFSVIPAVLRGGIPSEDVIDESSSMCAIPPASDANHPSRVRVQSSRRRQTPYTLPADRAA